MVACATRCWLLLCALAQLLGVQGLGRAWHAPPLNASVPPPRLWFDYPDDDAGRVRAAYERLGEPPRAPAPNPLPRLLRRVTLGAAGLVLLLLLAQVVAPLLSRRTHEAEPALRSSQGSLIGAAAPAPPLLGGCGGEGGAAPPPAYCYGGGAAPQGGRGSGEAPPPPARLPSAP